MVILDKFEVFNQKTTLRNFLACLSSQYFSILLHKSLQKLWIQIFHIFYHQILKSLFTRTQMSKLCQRPIGQIKELGLIFMNFLNFLKMVNHSIDLLNILNTLISKIEQHEKSKGVGDNRRVNFISLKHVFYKSHQGLFNFHICVFYEFFLFFVEILQYRVINVPS